MIDKSKIDKYRNLSIIKIREKVKSIKNELPKEKRAELLKK